MSFVGFVGRGGLAHCRWRFIVVADYRKNSEYLGKNVCTLFSAFILQKDLISVLAIDLVRSRRTDRGRPVCVCQGLANHS